MIPIGPPRSLGPGLMLEPHGGSRRCGVIRLSPSTTQPFGSEFNKARHVLSNEENDHMHYGLNLPNGGLTGDPRTAAELAALAEASGWDGVFLEDYIVWQGHQAVPTYDPWIMLAAMALRTTRVRLGITVTPLSRRRPWKVAREAVTLDHLSNGRMILGAGLGDTTLDVSLTHFGEVIDVKQRGEMLDEALEIVANAW